MKKYAGFTLLEVLVALSVTATALYAGFGSIRAATRGSGHLEITTLANWAALNAVNEMTLGKSQAESAIPEQAVTLYGHEFIVIVQPQAAATDEVKRLKITVAEASAPDAAVFSLETVSP